MAAMPPPPTTSTASQTASGTLRFTGAAGSLAAGHSKLCPIGTPEGASVRFSAVTRLGSDSGVRLPARAPAEAAEAEAAARAGVAAAEA